MVVAGRSPALLMPAGGMSWNAVRRDCRFDARLPGFAASRLPIARTKTAILVEGYLDLLALVQAGISNVVATCGTALTPDQARLLRRGAKTLVVLYDGDQAGLQAAVRACHVAMAAGLEPDLHGEVRDHRLAEAPFGRREV